MSQYEVRFFTKNDKGTVLSVPQEASTAMEAAALGLHHFHHFLGTPIAGEMTLDVSGPVSGGVSSERVTVRDILYWLNNDGHTFKKNNHLTF